MYCQFRIDESDSFQRIIRDILEILLRIVPGSTEALYFIARVQLLLGDAVGAEVQLQKAIQKNKTDLKVCLLLTSQFDFRLICCFLKYT